MYCIYCFRVDRNILVCSVGWVPINMLVKALTSSDADTPPPTPVIASTSYDMWCFGVLLYEFATGITLFRTDIREEVVDDTELADIAEWSDDVKEQALAHGRRADTGPSRPASPQGRRAWPEQLGRCHRSAPVG